MSGTNITGTLTFTSASVTCTYSRTAIGDGTDLDPLPLSSCSNGAGPGAAISEPTQLSFYFSISPYGGEIQATAVIVQNLDDGKACTNDVCINGVVSHTNIPANVVVGGDACTTGLAYCDGAGNANYGPVLDPDDGNECTTDTCSDGAAHNAPVAGCGVPSGSGTSYPGNGTVPSDLSQGMQFLYSSQTGINTSAMDAKRLAIIRGHVVDRDSGNPILGGATVSILNHSEFGTTTTRSDGWYDIVVNGGGPYVVQYNARVASITRRSGPSKRVGSIGPLFQMSAWYCRTRRRQ